MAARPFINRVRYPEDYPQQHPTVYIAKEMRYLQGDAIQRQTAQDSYWIRWHLPHLKWDLATYGTADVLRELREALKQPRRGNFSGEEWARQNQHNAEEESAQGYGYPYEWVGRRSAHRRPLPGTGGHCPR